MTEGGMTESGMTGSRMTTTLRRYGLLTACALQAQLAYRASLVLTLVASATSLLAQLYLWRAIYGADGHAVLAGFRLADMTSYLLFSNLLFLMLDNRVDHEIAADIMRGDILIHFVRPVSYTVQKFFTSLATVLSNGVLVGLPLCALGAVLFGLTMPRGPDVLLFAVSATLALLIGFLLNACVGALAFVTTNLWGIQMMKTATVGILSGYLIPLSFFSPPLRQVADWLPFQSMIHTPVALLLGKAGGLGAAFALIGQQLCWVLLLGAACAALWRQLGKRLDAVGG